MNNIGTLGLWEHWNLPAKPTLEIHPWQVLGVGKGVRSGRSGQAEAGQAGSSFVTVFGCPVSGRAASLCTLIVGGTPKIMYSNICGLLLSVWHKRVSTSQLHSSHLLIGLALPLVGLFSGRFMA